MSKKRPIGKQKESTQKKVDWKGLDIVHPEAAGIDVGGSEHWVAISPDRDPEPVRRFGCFTADLREMARWLIDKGVRSVAMQSTGVYWMPVLEVLEQHGLAVFLVNARHTKNLPGRKSDDHERIRKGQLIRDKVGIRLRLWSRSANGCSSCTRLAC